MPPAEKGDGCTEQHHQLVTLHTGRHEEALSHALPPSFPVIVSIAYEKKKTRKQEQERPASLPDDALMEILSRVPYRSLCRFKCVCKPWLALCSDLDIHNRSPRVASGFFFISENCDESLSFHDLTVGGGPPLVDPTLAFLGSYKRNSVQQCCTGGLLLCKSWVSRYDEDKYSYIVCNPATEKWTVLPPIENSDRVDGPIFVDDHGFLSSNIFELNESEHFLGFDTANPSSFVVVVPLILYIGEVREVAIYSSETGGWTSMHSRWGSETIFVEGCEESVFVNGRIHFTFHSSIVKVDIEGDIWNEIEVPTGHKFGSIGQSQEYLHYWDIDSDCRLSVWVLEDYGTGNCILKHTVDILELFGRHCYTDDECFIAFHPYCNLILPTRGKVTVSYDMDSRKVQVLCTSKELLDGIPYIPCFAKWPSDVALVRT